MQGQYDLWGQGGVSEGGEVPRATSAPPYQDRLDLARRPDGRFTPSDPMADMRLDPQYEAFYRQENEAGRKAPPPVDANSVYQQLPPDLLQSFQTSSGLETINERPPSNINPQVLQALAQAQAQGSLVGDRFSPAPPADLRSPIPQLNSNGVDPLLQLQLQAAFSQLQLGNSTQPHSHSPAPQVLPPMQSPSPNPLLSRTGTPGITNAALLSSILALQNQSNMPAVDYGTAYQAAYMAALQQQQQQEFANNAAQMTQLPLQQQQLAAQVAASLMLNPVHVGNPSLHSAAAAAAAAAVQNMMGGRGSGYDSHSDREDRKFSKTQKGKSKRESDRHTDRAGHEDANGQCFQNLDEVVGQVLHVAKDQNGCRFLQRKFDEGGAEAIEVVLPEILENLHDLMTDPFGNYLTQKLLDRCSEEQRLKVLRRASEDGALVEVALNTHGTRAVQKLIETIENSPEQVRLVVDALRPGVYQLIKDLNGNHVIQRCLQKLGSTPSQFVYDAAMERTEDVAMHRHGCCVVQRCIDYADASQKQALIRKIIASAYKLSMDGFGNYCLQYVIDLHQSETNRAIIEALLGHFPELSQQKFSSNVVECILKLKDPNLTDLKEKIIRELMNPDFMPKLIQDGYANFVIQTALGHSSGALHAELVEAIRPFLSTLRTTSSGKRILAKLNVKF